MSNKKLKVGLYWAASCGGCEIAVLDINETVLQVIESVDILFWPVAMDSKYADIRAKEDGFFDAFFFNGSVRTEEQEELAHLFRQKSKLLIAFGSCAHEGCIPGLANLASRQEVFDRAYLSSPSTDNPDKIIPLKETEVKEGKLGLPGFHDRVKPLNQVVPVDYYLPGCPPPPDLIINAFTAIIKGKLPTKGTVLAPEHTLCEDCDRNPVREKKMDRITDLLHTTPDQDKCFLEQGIICMGPVTRAGCGQRCINGNFPCQGCMGPPPGVSDMGAKMVSALASIMNIDNEEGMSDDDVAKLMAKIRDPIGTFYMYNLPASILGGRWIKDEKDTD